MKKITVLAVVVLALSSCFKQYECHCVYDHPVMGQKEEYLPYTSDSRKEAEELCELGFGLYDEDKNHKCELILID
jgi:hypothetical protein